MDSIRLLSISDILNISRPLTGAASLHPDSVCSPPSKRCKLDCPDEGPIESPLFPSDRNHNPGTLTLCDPVILIGTVDLLPCDSDRPLYCLNHCLSFSDGSSRVCCYVLDFDLNIIGRKIHVLAWNFLPFKHETGGILEVVRWSLLDLEAASGCDSLLSIRPVCSSQVADLKACCRVLGIVKSVSPIFCAPCRKEKEDSQKNTRGALVECVDAIGFLAEILTCGCHICRDSRFVTEHGCHLLKENNCHSFTNSELVYFIKPTSLWRPVLYRLIGKLVTVSRLKKKLVFVGGDSSYVMFVSTTFTMVSLGRLPVNVMPVASLVKSENSYNGVITGIYMQGMVIELDDKICVLTTDPVLALQHSLRLGAIVSVRNYHLVNAKYSWLNTFLLGTCLKTYISIKSFSTTSTRQGTLSQTTSLLENFIDSLTFSAKFWVLLLVSCFKKKFVGIFSHKDILGSKNKEGFVQTYASRFLPQSAFQVKPGFFMDFCKHGQCSHRRELNLSFLRLVIPISNLISWCEVKWILLLPKKHNDHEMLGRNQYLNHFFCRGTLSNTMIRRIISSDEVGFILMGTFKICQQSGTLQFADATGSLDVVVPDLPLDVDFQAVYEVKDFKLVMEGSPNQVDHIQNYFDGPLSWRAIFQQFSHKATVELTVYVHFYLKDSSRMDISSQLPSYMNKTDKFKCSNSETYHLLYVTHKFPVYQSLHDDVSLSNNSGLFAEALILPYNLVPCERVTNKDSKIAEVLLNNLDEKANWIAQLKDTINGLSKQIQVSTSIQLSGPVNVPSKDVCYNQGDSRVLLQFGSDSFNKHQLLRVGSYYLLKCSKRVLDYASKDCGDRILGKPIVISKSNFWSLSLTFGEYLREPSGGDDSSHDERINEFSSNEDCRPEERSLRFFDRTHELSDVYLHISTDEMDLSQQYLNSLFPALDEIINVSSCIQKMIAEVPSGIINMLTSELPQGNQVTLCGNIENIFIYDCRPKCSVSSGCAKACKHWSICKVCIYVNDDHHKVRICGSLCRYACPVGLGPGANATFHKVLLTRISSRQNELVLTPMSFIVVNTVKEIDSQCNYRGLIQESRWNIHNDELLNTISLGFISKMMQCMDSNLIRLNCRVVGITMLVMENQMHDSAELRSGRLIKIQAPSIRVAGFLIDDGSSLCSCWADYDRAETLIRLHESTKKTFFRSHDISKVLRSSSSQHTVGYYLRKLLKKHQRVIIRDHGAAFDLSCENLAFSFDSDEVFSNVEERLLRFIILNACHSSTFNVVGNMVNSNALFSDNLEFFEYDQALQSMPHLWVKEVGHVDPIREARNIWNDLCRG
ncbi:CST complex subunit CTC1 isoform X2 [Canna indica]|uniref:CST complex subunit CTC1 n=1 Tax=Canna indica TaxID=4628 RepID=A0AAQ3L4B5_9LILI|nr:CST complex subunit CTC1 isoform X2 [Canna indica]